jgi:hypothetical protein
VADLVAAAFSFCFDGVASRANEQRRNNRLSAGRRFAYLRISIAVGEVFDLIEQTLDGFLGFHLEHQRFRRSRACADDTGTN